MRYLLRSLQQSKKCLLTAGLLATSILHSFAQSDGTEKTGLFISPSLQFVTVQKAGNSIDLKATLLTKIKGTPYKLPHLKVNFILITDSGETVLGHAITDGRGKAQFTVRADSLVANKEGKLHFKAAFAGNKQMDPADGDLSISRAQLELSPVKQDSVYTANVKLIDPLTGKGIPKTTVGVFVQRTFSSLKLGEGTTDDNGEASVELPAGLAGDAKGNISLQAKIDDNETYGNIESSAVEKWGKPVSDKILAQPRALWSSHPPLWMLITFLVLMFTVWGHYIVIVYQLFRLRKEEPHPAA